MKRRDAKRWPAKQVFAGIFPGIPAGACPPEGPAPPGAFPTIQQIATLYSKREKVMEKARVSVIGSGLMGHGIAQIFALHGHPVVLYDLKQEFLDRALVNVRANLDLMAERGIAPQGAADTALANIRTTLSLEEAARADFIIEAVIEDMPLKQRIFAELDALCAPETVIASNTSVMSITEIASKSVNRGRMVGTHFWNPPYFIPLVEVVQGDDTADKTVEYTMNILRSVGKHPIHCRKDVPGFVANRMQHALWREAVYIVEQGIADAATVDEAVRLSFGMRLPQLGPLENADMVGIDLTWSIHDYILKHLCNATEPSPLLDRLKEEGKLGFKTGEGFQKWDEESIRRSRQGLQQYLIDFTARKTAKD